MSNISIDLNNDGGVVELNAQVDPNCATETMQLIDRLVEQIMKFNAEQEALSA